MSSGRTIAALAFVLALLTGCGPRPHKTAPPAAAQAPSVAPAQMAELISPVPPPLPMVSQRPIKLDTTAPPEPKVQTAVAPPHRAPRRHSRTPSQEAAQADTKPAPATPDTVAQNAPAVAAATQPSEMSPIGQLSTANDTSNTADRNDIIKQIDATENALNAIKRPLNNEEQKTVMQIRTYITRARDALKNDDLDGARTTSTKAHVLLLELTQ